MRRTCFALALIVIVLLAGCAKPPAETGATGPAATGNAPAKTVELKLSLILGDNSEWYAGAKKWADLVAERTNGEVKVNIFPEAQLANHSQRTELEMVQSGAIDCSLESNILLSILDQRWSVFSLPWLFPDHEVANAVCDGPLGQKMLDTLGEKQLVGLAYGVNGFRQLTNNKRRIAMPDHIKGLKTRVPDITMYIDLFKLLGADPSTMNFGELFPALRQGTMDAQENPLAVIAATNLYDVQKYLSIWDYSYDCLVLCMNKSKWDSLSAENQEVLKTAAKEAFDYQRKLIVDGEVGLKKLLADKGMVITVLSQGQRDAFAEKAAPIYEQYEGIIGADLIQEFRDAVKSAQPSVE